MNSHQPRINNNNLYKESEYKTICAGRNCKSVETEFFNIALNIKSGWLCLSCKKALEGDGFVFYRNAVGLGVGEGKFVKVPTDEKNPIKHKEE